MAVKGVFASDSSIQGNPKTDFAAGLLQTVPTGSAPMFALSSGMKSRNIKSVIHTWFEENKLSGRVSLTNDIALTTTGTVSAAEANQVVPGQIYMVESSSEYIYIDAVSGGTLTVSRGFAGTTVVDVDGSSTPVPMQRVQQAHEEGSDRPVAFANLGFPRFQYVGIFRNAWDVTGTAEAIDYHTGDQVAKNMRDAGFFHAEDIERSSIWGRKAIGTKNGRAFRTMDGIRWQLSTNVRAQGSDTKWSDLKDFMKDIFSTNIKGAPNERIAFCGNEVLVVLERLAELNATINLTTGQTDFGMEITTMRSPFGTLRLVTHPLMNESPVWQKDLMVLHPAAIEYLYLRRTFEDTYKNETGRDAKYGVFTTECCIICGAEATSGYYSGIDTAAAES